LALPSLLEQAEIVRRVGALAGLLHDVEKRVNRSVDRAFCALRRPFFAELSVEDLSYRGRVGGKWRDEL